MISSKFILCLCMLSKTAQVTAETELPENTTGVPMANRTQGIAGNPNVSASPALNSTCMTSDTGAGAVNDTDTNAAGCEAVSGPPSVQDLLASQPDQLLMFTVANYFSLYVHPVICGVGVLGNTLSFIVMTMRHNRRLSSCVYMASLALADNWLLIVVFIYWLKSSAGLGPMTSWECAWLIYLGVVPGTFGMVCVVSMTTERFVAVRFPFKSGQLCTAARARITVVVVAVVVIIYALPYLFYSAAVRDGADCFPLVTVTTFTSTYSFINLALNSAVPFTILIVFNSLIIKTIRNRKKFFQKDQTADKDKSKESPAEAEARHEERARERQLTVMLVMVSVTFLVLTFPGYLRVVVDLITGMSKDPTQIGSFYLYYSVTIRLYYLNSAVNFFLYCMGGSKFRGDVFNVVTCFRRTRAGGSQASGSTSSIATRVSSISQTEAA